MSNIEFPPDGREKAQMFFNKSLAFDEEEFSGVALAADHVSVRSNQEVEFIEKLRAGDAAAFDVLVNRYSGDIYALLYRITEDAEEAGDLTQETFLNALRAINKFRGDADLKTWLFRIAVNESRNRFRWWKRRGKGKTLSLDAPLGTSETTIGETFSSNENNPEENALRKERELKLQNALNEMSQNFREAIILCDIEGFKYDEIAEILQISVGTVKSRIARGRDELRKKLMGI